MECHLFRDMCLSLNPKAPFLSRRQVKDIIAEKKSHCEAAITDMLSADHYGLTSDSWTSRRQQTYTAITVHWINHSFLLHSCALGCQPNEDAPTTSIVW